MSKSDRPVTVTVPGSKSITNRALLLAAMSEGTSILRGCMASDDASVFLECIRTLGFQVKEKESEGNHIVRNVDITVTGCGGKLPVKQAELFVGSAGTAARFLVAMLALSDGEYLVRSSEQMKRRPMQPLIEALRDAGAEVKCTEEEGHFPLRIRGVFRSDTLGSGATSDNTPKPEMKARCFRVNIDQSSQFLSALLIAAGTLKEEVRIEVEGTHGLAYVEMTLKMMRQFGVNVKEECLPDPAASDIASQKKNVLVYSLAGTGSYRAQEYAIEPDMSAAAYFYAAAALGGSSIRVRGVKEKMLQGDTAFLDVLEKMGCEITTSADDDVKMEGGQEVIVMPPADGNLHGGFTIDMSSFSDQALTLAALAAYADAPVTITGIAHIRLQECDRIRAICENLSRLGISVTEQEDGVTIVPGEVHAAELESYDDHRVAMSFALCGLRTEGIGIKDRECCRKTFAEYFEVLDEVKNEFKKAGR